MDKHDRKKPVGAGKSSFNLIDQELFFSELDLKADITLVDVACGIGRYSQALAEVVGEGGRIFAVDVWEEGIRKLTATAAEKGLGNISPLCADASEHMPVEDHIADVCLVATALHDFVLDGTAERILKEIVRVLKPLGTLVIVEFHKVDGPPGPPITSRLAPQQVEACVVPFGFTKMNLTDIGPHNYLMIFKK